MTQKWAEKLRDFFVERIFQPLKMSCLSHQKNKIKAAFSILSCSELTTVAVVICRMFSTKRNINMISILLSLYRWQSQIKIGRHFKKSGRVALFMLFIVAKHTINTETPSEWESGSQYGNKNATNFFFVFHLLLNSSS